MQRFTNRYSNGKAFIINCTLQSVDGIEDVIEKLAEYEDLEEQGRLIKLTVQDAHPCNHCNIGWDSVSFNGCKSCRDDCEILKKYNEKYSE